MMAVNAAGMGVPSAPKPYLGNLTANQPKLMGQLQPGLGNKMIPSYKKGGRVKETGLALLHKGEHVIPVKEAKSKALRSKLKHK
jgi:hypothetical protein